MDYRIYSLIALVLWGLWAYFSKTLANEMKTELLAFYTTIGSLIIITIYTLVRTKVSFNPLSGYAIGVGAIAMIATFAFYAALAKGPVTVVVPWTGLYFLIPVVLGFIFLKEPITFNHVLGVVFAIAAIFFLSR
jgi:uncharacterized membrane protein